MIGMPLGRPLTDKKTPTKKEITRARAGGKFSKRGEESFTSEQSAHTRAGESIASDSAHARAVFLLAGHNIAPGGRDAG